MNLFLDIETLPDQTPGALEAYRQTVKAPGQYKKPDSIATWLAENADAEADRLWRKTALNGGLGEILCIGFAWRDEPVTVLSRRHYPQEIDLLRGFHTCLAAELGQRKYSEEALCVIGHNVGFDLRFLFQRTAALGATGLVRLPTEHRPGSPRSFCTMAAWAGYRDTVSLADLADYLKLPHHKGDITGDKIADLWRVDPQQVEEYCAADVDMTRQIYYRLQLTPPPDKPAAVIGSAELEELDF